MSWRAALIGCGRIGSTFADDREAIGIYSHAEAYQTCPETELVAVCDADAGKLVACGARWRVESRYSDPEALLAEQKPEIISICTPDETHYPLAVAALRLLSTKALFIEKPLAMKLDQAREVAQRCRERGVALAVNYSRRYAASHLAIRDSIRSGQLGDIQAVGGFYTKGTVHNGTHWFDLARFFFGEVKQVRGFDSLREKGNDPTLNAMLEFASGLTANLQACPADAFSLFEMDIIGTQGRVRLTDSGNLVETSRVAADALYSGYQALIPSGTAADGLRDVTYNALLDLVECLKTGAQPRCSGDDAVAALQIALAIRQSAATGQLVEITG